MGRYTSEEDHSRMTSQSDMNVIPQRQEYMWSLLQRYCYVERHSGEGGSTSILNPLSLTYHFGRAKSTPVRRRTDEITGNRTEPSVKHHVVDKEEPDNVISDASFGYCLGVHSKKRDEADRTRQEARATQSLREVGGSSHKKKNETGPQCRKPW